MEAFFKWIGNAANLLGLLSTTFALFAWLEARRINKKHRLEQARLNKEITITLKSENGDHYSLPVNMYRRELTRAELLGYLGMLPTKDKNRFRIDYLTTQAFFKELNKALSESDSYEIFIPCTQQEYNQFNFEDVLQS